METFIEIISITAGLIFFIILLAIVYVAIKLYLLYKKNEEQSQHSILRGFPLMGKIRYLAEKIGPELRQYWFDSDTQGKPFSRTTFVTLVKMAKYATTIIPFGSKRDFEADGFYLRPHLFPLNVNELAVDLKKVSTKIYRLLGHKLFWWDEIREDKELSTWGLTEKDYIIIGKNDDLVTNHFIAKSFFGSTAMSYGAISKNAIEALAYGTAAAETWTNSGEGGLSPYHLKAGGQVIYQLGPSLFGSRNLDGSFAPEKFTANMSHENVVACEIKFAQGAKARGGHLPKEKLNMEIANLRGVKMGEDVESPNRNAEFNDTQSLISFISYLKILSYGKPIGIKIVVGQVEEIDSMFKQFAENNVWPNFITVDGSEGGSGATYQEMADSLSLPIFEALPIVVELLKKHGLRDKVIVFASGKLVTADQIAIALCLGADCVNTGRGMMMALGCIMAGICENNHCPTGIATTDPEKVKTLVVEEKKYRVTNYILTLRQSLFTLGAACGITSPRHFNLKHLGYRKNGKTMRGERYIKYLMKNQLAN
ncbi:FMN-binding glutamate synthase family protein [Candidatus Gracilibacteria bacterium]|nr:FMN-binding glutamate synthase family protein [Candidatus Gracilibacteria bacterium]